MSKIFRFDCYPHDWLLDTSRLTPEDRGIYVQIVMLIYARGGQIDNDAKWIAGSCNCSSRLVVASISRLVQMDFIQLSDGKITQKRAERELKVKRTQIENGAKTPRKQSENEDEFIGIKTLGVRVDTLDLPSTNPTPNPIPDRPPNPPQSFVSDFHDRFRLDSEIPAAWQDECMAEMGWPGNVVADVWTKFSGFQKRKIGQAGLKTTEEWVAEWRTWYRKENIRPQSQPLSGSKQAPASLRLQSVEEMQRQNEILQRLQSGARA